jgi:hypothetical protein
MIDNRPTQFGGFRDAARRSSARELGPVGSHAWDNLVIERRASPPLIAPARFCDWMDQRRIFISSPIDDEMRPIRAAVAAYLRREGAIPVMWDEITAQERRPEDAYLEGIELSGIFILIVSPRYGVTDETGYSAIHKEANRAKELDLPRLLFESGAISRADRAGPVNEWIDSLHSELSVTRYTRAEELVVRLDRRLKEFASQQETYWIKLGALVFPGSVFQRSRQDGTEFLIKASLRDPSVRHTVSGLGNVSPFGRYRGGRDTRLTWGIATHPVRIVNLKARATSTSIDDVEISCTKTGDAAQSGVALRGGTFTAGGRTFGLADQVRDWADQALYGLALRTESGSRGLGLGMHAGVDQNLPMVLESVGAQGWLAEGLSRLYAVEESSARFGGSFQRLEVGPATATGLRLAGNYRLPGIEPESVDLSGRVPFTPGDMEPR